MDLSKYDVEIKHHAFRQALARGIPPDLIEDTLCKGKVETYAKNGIRFVAIGSKRRII